MFNQTKTNRHLRLGVAFLMAMMLSIGQIFAQNVNVSGKVTDQNGEPVAGAAVYVKGTKTGTYILFDLLMILIYAPYY